MLTPYDRVMNGIKWLNETMPCWQFKINTETLNIRLNGVCIRGQLGLNEACSSTDIAEHVRLGFWPDTSDGDTPLARKMLLEIDSERLTIIWKDYINTYTKRITQLSQDLPL